LDRAIGHKFDKDAIAMSCKGFVYAVVNNFKNEVM
jgi:hypothetical protein